MNDLLHLALFEKWSCVEFMLHSTELMPGGSPNFPTPSSIDLLYENMERTFATASELGFVGMTLTEFYKHFQNRSPYKDAPS